MKIYMADVFVGSYEIVALGESPAKCFSALVSKYHKNFGTFRENGFKNKQDWLEYHGYDCDEALEVIELNSAICK